MRADNNGEGGIMALLALNLRNTNFSHQKKLLLISIGFIGASLFFGDGIITPAISVLSAVEGLSIATDALDPYIVPIAISIVTAVFVMQKYGTAFVGKFFGPLTLLWFFSLGILRDIEHYSNAFGFGHAKPTLGISVYRDQPVNGLFHYGCGSVDRHRWRSPVRRYGTFWSCADSFGLVYCGFAMFTA